MKNEMKAAESREAELIEVINQTRREMKKRGLHAELLEFYKANAELDEQTIFMITPTYSRHTQKADMTRLLYTLLHVPNLHWIIVEDR